MIISLNFSSIDASHYAPGYTYITADSSVNDFILIIYKTCTGIVCHHIFSNLAVG